MSFDSNYHIDNAANQTVNLDEFNPIVHSMEKDLETKPKSSFFGRIYEVLSRGKGSSLKSSSLNDVVDKIVGSANKYLEGMRSENSGGNLGELLTLRKNLAFIEGKAEKYNNRLITKIFLRPKINLESIKGTLNQVIDAEKLIKKKQRLDAPSLKVGEFENAAVALKPSLPKVEESHSLLKNDTNDTHLTRTTPQPLDQLQCLRNMLAGLQAAVRELKSPIAQQREEVVVENGQLRGEEVVENEQQREVIENGEEGLDLESQNISQEKEADTEVNLISINNNGQEEPMKAEESLGGDAKAELEDAKAEVEDGAEAEVDEHAKAEEEPLKEDMTVRKGPLEGHAKAEEKPLEEDKKASIEQEAMEIKKQQQQQSEAMLERLSGLEKTLADTEKAGESKLCEGMNKLEIDHYEKLKTEYLKLKAVILALTSESNLDKIGKIKLTIPENTSNAIIESLQSALTPYGFSVDTGFEEAFYVASYLAAQNGDTVHGKRYLEFSLNPDKLMNDESLEHDNHLSHLIPEAKKQAKDEVELGLRIAENAKLEQQQKIEPFQALINEVDALMSSGNELLSFDVDRCDNLTREKLTEYIDSKGYDVRLIYEDYDWDPRVGPIARALLTFTKRKE